MRSGRTWNVDSVDCACAIERGVSSCMQESWSSLRGPLKAHFQLAPDEMIYCGMALGVAIRRRR